MAPVSELCKGQFQLNMYSESRNQRFVFSLKQRIRNFTTLSSNYGITFNLKTFVDVSELIVNYVQILYKTIRVISNV